MLRMRRVSETTLPPVPAAFPRMRSHFPVGAASSRDRRDMGEVTFEGNEVLFGVDGTEGIVAVEPVGDDRMRLFLRRRPRMSWGAGGSPRHGRIVAPLIV